MGYCNYCKKDVYSSATCNYCNNILAPRMDSKLLEEKRNTLGNNDKWQSTYGKKKFFNDNINLISASKSAYMASARKKAIPQFNSTDLSQESNLKSCSQCHKNQKSWSDQNFTIYKSIYYCKPCLAQKLTCPKCNNQVKSMDSQVTFQQHTYHSDCFQCFQCSTSLCDKDAVENAKGNPVCTTCQPLTSLDSIQLQQPSPMANPSISTPLLNNGSTNPLLIQRTRRSSMFTRNLPLESRTPTSTLLSKIKEKSPRVTISQSTTTGSTDTLNRIRTPSPPITLNRIPDFTMSTPLLKKEITKMDHPAPIVSPKKTESTSRGLRRKKRTIMGSCKECGEDVSKKEYRGLETLDGEIVCFHTFCLKCALCRQTFDGIEFRTDGKNFYHTKCPTAIPTSTASTPIMNERNGSPCSVSEDESCPKTPPPIANAHFDVVSTSPVDELLPSIDNQQNNDQKKKNVITPDLLPSTTLLCDTCNEPVTDTYLELGNSFYHQECLTCAGCNNTIPAEHKIRKLRDRLYCDGCATTLKRNKSVFLSNLVMNDMPKRTPTITSPSDIFKSRSTNLPRLGGCRTCDGCRKELPVSDSHPGPNATRWHKKCLKCPGCNKQMDSFGHMKTDKVTKTSVVHCRECLDNMPRNNFVR